MNRNRINKKDLYIINNKEINDPTLINYSMSDKKGLLDDFSFDDNKEAGAADEKDLFINIWSVPLDSAALNEDKTDKPDDEDCLEAKPGFSF
ncbi:hypothetical protein [Paludibacter sp. 221]|uniref:hypothetical protein n=1 Tax=Paludibacter sp. 221 TaxID=2302939 RepID=UPI0013D89D7D|nr:hypothetical protein [Paludibacter sp. 221]